MAGPDAAPRDPARVDLSDAREVGYWTRELGASEELLREAVSAAGDEVERVREYLGSGS